MLPFRYNRGIGKNTLTSACIYIKKKNLWQDLRKLRTAVTCFGEGDRNWVAEGKQRRKTLLNSFLNLLICELNVLFIENMNLK